MTALLSTNPPQDAVFRPFNLVAFGSSAGGLGALKQVLRQLPRNFPVPIVVVQHLSATFASQLPEILNYDSPLPCRWADDGDGLAPGRILVARAGANLVLARDLKLKSVAVAKPRMGWPSVDAFFCSMAAVLGPAAIGVVLSGTMQDGASGISAVRRAGGATIAQDPRSAEFAGMPTAAIDLGRADLAMSSARISLALQILADAGIR
jgi:two-component system, chemotaxis family, protein-glutamate methylesterase/glutaminase